MTQMVEHTLPKLSRNTDYFQPQSETFEYICITKNLKVKMVYTVTDIFNIILQKRPDVKNKKLTEK